MSNILNDLDTIQLIPRFISSNKAKYEEKHINTHYDYSKKDAGLMIDSGVEFRNKQLLTHKYSSLNSSPTSPVSLGKNFKQLNTYDNVPGASKMYNFLHLSAPNDYLKVQFLTEGVNPKDGSDPNSNYHPRKIDEIQNQTLSDVDEPSNTFTYRQADIDEIETEMLYRYNNRIEDFRFNIRSRVELDNSNIDFTTVDFANGTSAVSGLNVFNRIIPYVSDYQTTRIENRIGVGDPGNPYNKNLRKFTKGRIKINGNTGAASPTSYDKITAKKLYSSTDPQFLDILKEQNDLVNFRITSINNNKPSEEIYMHFRAFLGSISDNYSANWNSQKYVGRGENFYTYDGFDRKISLSFTLAAQSRVELIPMYRKLNYLISQMAPDYSGAGLMRGPLVTLTIGGYICDQPGFITGLNVEMGEDTTWEIGIDEDGKMTKMAGYDDYTDINPQLAHVIKVSGFSFTPIHKFAVKKADWKNLGATPYILNCGEPKPKKEEIIPEKQPVKIPEKPQVFDNQFIKDSDQFVPGSTSLKQLDKLIKELLNSTDNINIVANASREGTVDYNLKLTKKRAAAVKKYLEKNGIDASRITAIGVGEANADQSRTNPKDRNFTIERIPQ